MKRKMALILAGMLLLGMVSLLGACNSETTTTPPVDSTAPTGTGTTPTAPEGTTAPPAESANKGGTLVVRASGDPVSMQPNTVPDDYNYAIAQNIYSRLAKLDGSKNVIPDLATEWFTSEDGMQITFKLVENALWQDGEKVTSEDVKYTFDTIRTTPEYVSYESLSGVESIDTPDDYTVVFNMKAPDVSVIGSLSWYGVFVLPEHIFNNGQAWDDNPASKEPVGCGPFKFVSYEPGVSIVLERNDNYFQNEVLLDKVIYSIIPDNTTAVQALLNGEIDILEGVPDNELDNLRAAGIVLEENAYPSPMYLAFNFMKDYVTDYPVRKAIAQAVNRQEICDKVFNGVRSPEFNFYPSLISWASNSDAPAPQFDIQGAIKTLEEAGLTKDAEGYYVRGIEIICYTDANTPDIAKLIQANCKEAGIEIIVSPMEYQAWSQIVWDNMYTEGGNFKTSLMGGFQGPDPAALNNRIGTGKLNNIGQYSNARIDELFQQALLSSDQAVRQPLYHEIQKIMSEELPIIPIINYAAFDAQAANVHMSPIQSAGKAGWQEYSYTYLAD